jgi:hypothetical protein
MRRAHRPLAVPVLVLAPGTSADPPRCPVRGGRRVAPERPAADAVVAQSSPWPRSLRAGSTLPSRCHVSAAAGEAASTPGHRPVQWRRGLVCCSLTWVVAGAMIPRQPRRGRPSAHRGTRYRVLARDRSTLQALAVLHHRCRDAPGIGTADPPQRVRCPVQHLPLPRAPVIAWDGWIGGRSGSPRRPRLWSGSRRRSRRPRCHVAPNRGGDMPFLAELGTVTARSAAETEESAVAAREVEGRAAWAGGSPAGRGLAALQ